MNGSFGLLENIQSKGDGVPMQQTPRAIEEHEFVRRFADASLSLDDALDGEGRADIPSEKEQPDMLSPGSLAQPTNAADLKESLILSFGQGENNSSEPLLKGENISEEISTLAAKKANEIGRQGNRVAADISKGILQMGQGGDDQPIAEPFAAPRKINDQKIPATASAFENAIPADQKSFSDNLLIRPVGEKPAVKLNVQDDAPLPAVRYVLPINQTLSPVTSLPLTDSATVAPMAIRQSAAIASPLPTLGTMIDDHWVARLGQEIGKLTGEKRMLSFQLKPQNLGKLHVEIVSDAVGNIVRVDTDNEIAKQLILGAQGRLEQDIRLSGSKLLRVDVTSQEQAGSQPGHHDPDTQARGPAIERRENESTNGLSSELLSPATMRPDGSSSYSGARYA